jgi:hypothetical protein
MAQTGFTPISTYYTTTAAAVPTAGNLVNGELALNINTADGKLFYKDSAGVVQVLASRDANAGNFTNISVSGVASFADGTVSAPSITNIGDTNTGIYFPAADTIAFTEGGVESMRITSAGNLGIGVTAPVVNLSLNGAVVTTGTANILRLLDDGGAITSTTSNSYGFGHNNATGAFSYTAGTGGFHAWFTANTERMRIDSNGNVGIGTTGLSGRLALQVSSGTGAIAYKSTTGGFAAYQLYTSNENIIGTIGVTSTNDTFYLGYASQPVFAWNSNCVAVGGVIPSTSGAGITFPASQSASSNANTLDDYEEGTWTPTLSGWSGTYSLQTGRYTKIGRQVTLLGALTTTASSGTFTAFPGPAGFPFAGGSGNSAVYGTWAVFSGAQNLSGTIIAGGPLDGPANGATDSFPNAYNAGNNTGNWGSNNVNAAVAVIYRFQIIYFV